MTFTVSARQSTAKFDKRYPTTPKYLTRDECLEYLDKWNTNPDQQPKNWGGLTDADYQAKCTNITITHCLHWLETWCMDYELCQSNWADLYLNIVTYVSSKGFYCMKRQVLCVVRAEINKIEAESIAIFKELGLTMQNMAEAYGARGIPSGEPNRNVKDGNLLIGSIWMNLNGYRLPNSSHWGSSDPYTEALTLIPKEKIQPIRLKIQANKLARTSA